MKLRAYGTGAFSFSPLLLAALVIAGCPSALFGQLLLGQSGVLSNDPYAQQLYHFNAQVGDVIRVDISDIGNDPNFWPGIKTTDPNGSEVGLTWNQTSTFSTLSIKVAGTYTVTVFRGTYQLPPVTGGSYALQITRMASGDSKQNGGQCPCGQVSGTGSITVGEPVTLGTGNLFESAIDFQTAGANKLEFARYYNSRANLSGSFATTLGANWRSTFDRYIDIASATQVSAERPTAGFSPLLSPARIGHRTVMWICSLWRPPRDGR